MSTRIGAFETRQMAAHAVDALLAAGFHPDQVSVLGRHGELADVTPENETATSMATGASIGAVAGAVLVGVIALAVPGVGPLLAVGAWGALLPAALAGGLAGGLVGFLRSQGVPEEEAAHYAERVHAGAYLVAVHTAPGTEVQAENVLAELGAEGPIRQGTDNAT
ncbi:MAG: hypothetical protein NVSMB65_21670 [Chloroflexota bacterium]